MNNKSLTFNNIFYLRVQLLWIVFSLCFFFFHYTYAEESVRHGTTESEFVSHDISLKKPNYVWLAISGREVHSDHFNDVIDSSFQELQETNRLLLKGLEMGVEREFSLFWRISTRTEGSLFYAENSLNKHSTRYFSGVRNDALMHEHYSTAGASFSQTLNLNFEALKLSWSPYFRAGLGLSQIHSDLNYSLQNLGNESSSYEVSQREQNLFSLLGIGLLIKNNDGGLLFLEARKDAFITEKNKTMAQQNLPNQVFYTTENNSKKRAPQSSLRMGVGFLF